MKVKGVIKNFKVHNITVESSYLKIMCYNILV